MKLILLQLLSILCLSHQKGDINKGDINKGADEVKKFIDKCGWFKQKDPIIIKVNEKSIVNIEAKANDAPQSLLLTTNGGQESDTSSSSQVSPIESAITLENFIDQLKDLETGIIEPISKSSDVVEGVNNGVKDAFDSLAQAGQVLTSADEIIQQPLMMSGEIIQKSSALATGKDSSVTGEQKLPPDIVNSVAILPSAAILDLTKQQTIIDGSEANPNPNGLSPIQSQLPPPIQLTNPSLNPSSVAVTTQLQTPALSTILADVKPKLQSINSGLVVNQVQQATNLRPNNNQQSIQVLRPQFQNSGFMFGDILNLIPRVVIPQIQQAIPQFVPPVIYPILPKILTPILPPIFSNILFSPIPINPQEKHD